jgi:probable phosphoglycerate mutase
VRDAADGEVLAEQAETLGVTTNNVAEYRGLIAGLRAAREIDPDAVVEARLDSKLVVEQMSGRWKIKNADLQVLALEARRVLPPGRVTYRWVPRSENAHADRLLNAALDGDEPSRRGAATPEALPEPIAPPSRRVRRRWSAAGRGRTRPGSPGCCLAGAQRRHIRRDLSHAADPPDRGGRRTGARRGRAGRRRLA